MRTTITLEPDVEALLKRTMRERGLTFKEAVNDAVLKMTDDGRVKAIQEKWLGTYTELPREVPTM